MVCELLSKPHLDDKVGNIDQEKLVLCFKQQKQQFVDSEVLEKLGKILKNNSTWEAGILFERLFPEF